MDLLTLAPGVNIPGKSTRSRKQHKRIYYQDFHKTKRYLKKSHRHPRTFEMVYNKENQWVCPVMDSKIHPDYLNKTSLSSAKKDYSEWFPLGFFEITSHQKVNLLQVLPSAIWKMSNSKYPQWFNYDFRPNFGQAVLNIYVEKNWVICIL